MIDRREDCDSRYVVPFASKWSTPFALPYLDRVMARWTHVLDMLRAASRVGLSALVVVVALSATAVATGRTPVPLRALSAARVTARLPDAASPPRQGARAAVLSVDRARHLPVGGAATGARERAAAVVDEVAAERAVDEVTAAEEG